MRKRYKPCHTLGCPSKARAGNGSKFCAKCWALLGRPKRHCSVCDLPFAADQLNGKRCRPCVSTANHAKRVAEVYSITPVEYQAILTAQGGGCAICQRVPRAKRLAVDHDHTCCPGPVSCGQCVRGLCCRQCNRWVLGSVRDSVETLQRAIDYLTSPPAFDVLERTRSTA